MKRPAIETIERLLGSIQPEPGEGFERRMANAPWRGEAQAAKPGLKLGLRLALAGALLTLTAAALLVFTPQGRALAQQVLGYFTPAQAQSFPVTPYAPTSEAAYRLELVAALPAPTPTPLPPLGIDCDDLSVFNTYPCQIARSETKVGFDAKELPVTPKGLAFKEAIANPVLQRLEINYIVPQGGGYLTLAQGLGEFPPAGDWSAVPLEAIEEVLVNGQPAEYVEGYFAADAGANTVYWHDDMGVARLRWKEGERWFSLEKYGDPYPIEYLDKNGLIALAESLEYSPLPAPAVLDPEYLTSIQDAEILAGFDIQEPALLPAGFAFQYAKFDAASDSILLFYQDGRQSGNLIIWQTPLETAQTYHLTDTYPPSAIEIVSIGNGFGLFVAGDFLPIVPENQGTPMPTPVWQADDPHRGLHWENNGLQLSIDFYAAPDFGGRLEKEDLVAIAESMQTQ